MLKLEEWMSKDVITCTVDDSVLSISKKMAAKKIGSMIVVDKKKETLGIVTEFDILTKIVAKELSAKDTKVADIMSKGVISTDINTSVLALSQLMQKHHLRRMPITKNSKVVGIITSRDLIRIMSGV